jgi:ankyrin repeat protein
MGSCMEKKPLGLNESLVQSAVEFEQFRSGAGTPLHDVAFDAHLRRVRGLLDQGADPNFMPPDAGAEYKTPFMLAAAGGDVEVVKAMIASGCAFPLACPPGGVSAVKLAEPHPEALALILAAQSDFIVAEQLGAGADAPPKRAQSMGML